MNGTNFFTEKFNRLSAEEIENYHKTVFLEMDGNFVMQTRLEYYGDKLKFLGKDVTIGRRVTFRNPEFISIGDKVTIGDGCVLIAAGPGGITLDEGATLKYGVYLDSESKDEGYIHIGKEVYIGTGCCLHGHKGLEIGDHSLLAQNITITPYSHEYRDRSKIIHAQGGHSRKVTIGRDCYLGMEVCVLYSADIGEGSVIGAGSTVVKSIPPFSVAVGTPARVIKER